MTPNQFPTLFSTIIFGTAVSPGSVTLTGHDREQDWDIKKAKGQKGASSMLNGEPLGSFQATFYLADAESQIAWPAFQRALERSVSGPEPVATPIFHPDLAANRYTEVCVSSIGGVVRDARGGATVLVKFNEHRPPRPKSPKTATGGGGGATGGGGGAQEVYDPNSGRKRELNELLDEAKAL